MAKKNNNDAATGNVNNNSNNVNVNVNVPPARRNYTRKPKSNWLKRAIVGGIVTLLVSLAWYYIMSNIEAESKNSTTVTTGGKLEEASEHN